MCEYGGRVIDWNLVQPGFTVKKNYRNWRDFIRVDNPNHFSLFYGLWKSFEKNCRKN